MIKANANLEKSQASQLGATLKRMDETLSEWVSIKRTFSSVSKLATVLADTLGYDRSLFLAKPHPKKPLNHGKHRLLINKYAGQLIPGMPKVTYEVLERQLKENQRQLSMIEDAYKAGLRRTSIGQSETSSNGPQASFFYEFEQTCLVLQKILQHPNTGLEIIEGELYDAAPIVGDIVLISQAQSCKPFLDWQSGKGNLARKLLSADNAE
ncbi:hypothetical protein [Pseudomonas sp. MH10]|uniref:hypothetical protein n=1 Tax=Pseudomonas sp. MH10 TaxID=3048627 RepID=UPI002AC9C67B|nr:hypothetical protein [Pseudomonas sp. MH10]MEB0043590.1 hypothetical protein [Pseudomonas sp. MH10]WPX63592.1 hypothetical protein RHM59_22395 [Pseudomonas sp. MH10]